MSKQAEAYQPVGVAPSAPHAPPSYDEVVMDGRQGQPNPVPMTMPMPQPQYHPQVQPHGVGFQQQQMPMQQQQPPHTTVQQNTFILGGFGRDPVRLTCPNCHAQIRTSVDDSFTGQTHLIAILLCVFLCWPCICVPYCCGSKVVRHSCPNCKVHLGVYRD